MKLNTKLFALAIAAFTVVALCSCGDKIYNEYITYDGDAPYEYYTFERIFANNGWKNQCYVLHEIMASNDSTAIWGEIDINYSSHLFTGENGALIQWGDSSEYIAPLVGYEDPGRCFVDSADIGNKIMWLVCTDNLHYCRIELLEYYADSVLVRITGNLSENGTVFPEN